MEIFQRSTLSTFTVPIGVCNSDTARLVVGKRNHKHITSFENLQTHTVSKNIAGKPCVAATLRMILFAIGFLRLYTTPCFYTGCIRSSPSVLSLTCEFLGVRGLCHDFSCISFVDTTWYDGDFPKGPSRTNSISLESICRSNLTKGSDFNFLSENIKRRFCRTANHRVGRGISLFGLQSLSDWSFRRRLFFWLSSL